MSNPLAYFLTFTTYGSWLHGRDTGSVDREHNDYGEPVAPVNPFREQSRQGQLRQPEYVLDRLRREMVLKSICDVAAHRSWHLWAAHVRSNHVHIVVTTKTRPEKAMTDFKSWASRHLRNFFEEDKDRDRWTQHGSTRYLWTEDALSEKILYVLEGQGEPMSLYDGRSRS